MWHSWEKRAALGHFPLKMRCPLLKTINRWGECDWPGRFMGCGCKIRGAPVGMSAYKSQVVLLWVWRDLWHWALHSQYNLCNSESSALVCFIIFIWQNHLYWMRPFYQVCHNFFLLQPTSWTSMDRTAGGSATWSAVGSAIDFLLEKSNKNSQAKCTSYLLRSSARRISPRFCLFNFLYNEN